MVVCSYSEAKPGSDRCDGETLMIQQARQDEAGAWLVLDVKQTATMSDERLRATVGC